MGQPLPIPGEAFTKHNLLQPQFQDYENDFEKQLFFVINLVRYDPKNYGMTALKAAENHVLCQKLKKSSLESFLKKCPQLPQVRYEDEANKAARNNNQAVI